MSQKRVFKTAFAAAIEYLKKTDRIDNQESIAKEMKYDAGLISSFKNGTKQISPTFAAEFEKLYNLNLSEFDQFIGMSGFGKGELHSVHDLPMAASEFSISKSDGQKKTDPPASVEDLKDKYIALLEKQLRQNEDILREHMRMLEAIKQTNSNTLYLLSYAEALYQRLNKHFAVTEGVVQSEVEADMDKLLNDALGEYLKKDIYRS